MFDDDQFSDNENEEKIEEEEQEERHLSAKEKLSRARKKKTVTIPLTFDNQQAGTAVINEHGEISLTLKDTRVGKQIIRLFHQQWLNELSLNSCIREGAEVGNAGHKKNRTREKRYGHRHT